MRNISFVIIPIFLSLSLTPAVAASLAPAGVVTISYDLGDHRIPTWSNGALTVVANNRTATPVIHLFQADGRELTPTAFSIPGISKMLIEGAVYSKDERVAICGVAYEENGSGGGFVAWFAPGSNAATVVRTTPYSPYLIAAGPDGTIWTEGIEMVNGVENHPSINTQNGVIRAFDRAGKMVHSFVPRASLSEDARTFTQGLFASSTDRIAWYLETVNAYVEVQFDGTVKRYPGVPELKGASVSGVAITDDGRVFVSGSTKSPRTSHLYALDREHAVWTSVLVPDQQAPLLLGAEGTKLVAMGKTRFNIAFFSVQ